AREPRRGPMSAAPCVTCGGPPPSLGRVFFAALVFGAGYGLVVWYLSKREGETTRALHEKWKADLLAAIAAGGVVAIGQATAERGPPLELRDEPSKGGAS